METVSTLCATGSILAAAGVGYVFGQGLENLAVESASNSLYSSNVSRLRTPASDKKTSDSRTTSNPPSLRTTTNPPDQKPPSPSSVPASRKRTFALSNLPDSRDSQPNKKLFTGERRAFSNPFAGKISLDSLNRRSSSRLKRLASFTFSTASSPADSPGFDSKSLALSSESATPFFKSSSSPSPLPPNKLVKRSFSQHLVEGSSPGNWVATRQTISRPATRHKRLETLSRSSSNFKPNTDSMTAGTNPTLHPSLFRPKVPRDKFFSSSRHNTNTSIKRVYPDSTNNPVLLPPQSLSPVRVEVDTRLEHDFELYVFTSSPSTPLSLSQGMLQAQSEGPVIEEKPRRSFSIGDILSRGPPYPKEPSRKFKLSRGSRVFSSPLFTMRSQESDSEKHGETARKRLKRVDRRTSLPPSSAKPTGNDRETSEQPNQSSSKNNSPRLQRNMNDQSGPVPRKIRNQPSTNLEDSSSSSPIPPTSYRPPNWSMTPSDNASSQLGSDLDGKVFSSGDEDEGDRRSDSMYDSLRTGATRSSSGFKAPPLETLFDKESTRDVPTRLDAVAPKSSVIPTAQRPLDDEGSNSTPARTVVPERRDSGPSPSPHGQSSAKAPSVPSSPPLPIPLKLGNLEWDFDQGDDESFWYEDEEEEMEEDEESINQIDEIHEGQESEVRKQGPRDRSLRFATPQHNHDKALRKSNLFEWSEPQTAARRLDEGRPSRPQTVHGKKAPSARGDRAGGRRTPSGLHARSKSVPVLADLASDRRQMTSKFGTWGVGSKGVTEDWNDDFEFDLPDVDAGTTKPGQSSATMIGNQTMVVPESIKEQQTNVLANIGLLREWGLLIEELKDLRERAVSLGLRTDSLQNLFTEVDAMIELADQEADEDKSLHHRTPQKSKGTDLEEFGSMTSSPHVADALRFDGAEDGNAAAHHSPNVSKTSPTTRPRKNSQVVAQSVIEALQNRGKTSAGMSLQSSPRRKVPFDTTTLRHIVPHVSGLSKKFKQALGEAEGLGTRAKHSPRSTDPPFRRAFIDPSQNETSEDDDDDENDVKKLINDMGNTTLDE